MSTLNQSGVSTKSGVGSQLMPQARIETPLVHAPLMTRFGSIALTDMGLNGEVPRPNRFVRTFRPSDPSWTTTSPHRRK